MYRTAWLFTRGPESIRIVRHDRAAALVIYGPGSECLRQIFPTQLELTVFVTAYERELVTNGWRLEDAVTDRRASTRRAPFHGNDRRRRPEAE